MADAKSGASDQDLNFDQLFAEESKSGAKEPAMGEENLEELEAFLDEFEKNLDSQGQPAAKNKGEQPKEAPVAAAAPIATAVNEPGPTEDLVQGLLKEDDFNLDVGGAASAKPKAAAPSKPIDETPEFEAQPLSTPPLDIPSFIQAAPGATPTKPAPATAAGSSRISFILALTLGGVALLAALGAGWMALNATQAVHGVEMRVGNSPAASTDPRVNKLQGDVSALRKQVDEISKVVEGPIGHMANAYPEDMQKLHNRIAALEKAGSATVAAPVAQPSAAVVAPAEPVKPAVTGPAKAGEKGAPAKIETAKPSAAKQETPQATAAKIETPKADASKAEPATTAVAKAEPAKAEGAKATGNGEAATTEPAKPEAVKAESAKAPASGTKAAEAAKQGKWVVHLTSSDEKKLAQAQLKHARAAGIPATLTTAKINGTLWYRVTVTGFATRDEARAYAANQAAKAGFAIAWIAAK